LDERKRCKRNEISITIKKILKDKIQEGKVTEKWIEECLPQEYKRQYNKSESSSLSKQQRKQQINEVRTAQGNQILYKQQDDDKHTTPSIKMGSVDKQKPAVRRADKPEALAEDDKLKEVVRSADQVPQSELEFIADKTRYDDIRDAMNKSENLIHLIFDKSGTFMRAIPDVFRQETRI